MIWHIIIFDNKRVIAIEVILIGQVYKGTNSDVEEIMTKNGYVLYSHGQMDDIYVKKELLWPKWINNNNDVRLPVIVYKCLSVYFQGVFISLPSAP